MDICACRARAVWSVAASVVVMLHVAIRRSVKRRAVQPLSEAEIEERARWVVGSEPKPLTSVQIAEIIRDTKREARDREFEREQQWAIGSSLPHSHSHSHSHQHTYTQPNPSPPYFDSFAVALMVGL